MKKGFTVLFLVFYALFNPKITFAQQQTVGLFAKDSGQQNGYVLFSPDLSHYTYLIDKCGKLIHKWNTKYTAGLDAFLLPNGNLLSTGALNDPYFNQAGTIGGLVQIFDWNGTLLWNYVIADDSVTQNHDVYPMPNGDILVCEWERFTNAEAIAAGRDSATLKGAVLYSAKMQEIKPIGQDSAQIVWEWRLWDHLIQDHDPSKPNYGVVADHPELFNINYVDTTLIARNSPDWIHSNAVTYNADLDQVMMSARSPSEIWIIDHSTSTAEAASHNGGKHSKGGDFLYRWGNPATYNRGNASNRTLYAQHNPSWIPDGYPGAGNISVFNDGDERDYSSADIFAPPVDTGGNYKLVTGKAYGPDSSYWSYTAPNKYNFYSNVMGGVQRLINGNTLICEATKGNFFEVDSNKNIVWQYVDPDNGKIVSQGNPTGQNWCFRANLYMENFPAFNNKTLLPGSPIELNPYTYSCYMPYIYYLTPQYKIAQLKGYNSVTGIADSLNKGQGFIKGVVESQNLGSTSMQFSLIDSTGAIMVTTNKSYFAPSIGDSIMVGGVVNQSNGLTEYFADTIFVKTTGDWQKQPDIVTQLGETTESDLITINDVWLVDPSEWLEKGGGFGVHITDGKDTFVMYINYKTDLYYMKALTEKFNVTGIEIQNKPSAPFFGDYEIEPRGSFDIERVVQLYNISQFRLQDPTGVSDSADSRNNFYLKGIVQSPDFSTSGLNFSIKDSTGSIIVTAATDVNGYKPEVGDSIELLGLLIQRNGLIEVVADSISMLKNASPVLTPQLVPSLTEAAEAQLVKLDGYFLLDTSQWKPNGSSFNVSITNGADTFAMVINQSTDLYNMKVPLEEFNVTGIEIQNKPSRPFIGDYEIEPRGSFDIERVAQLYTIKQLRVQYPGSGVADSAGSVYNFYLKGIVQSPDFSTSGLNFSIEDSTGSIIVVSSTDISGYKPIVGDSIELLGLLIQRNGLIEVVTDSISILKNASPVLTPKPLSDLTENTEAQLVKLDDYFLLDTSQWKPNGNSFNVSISNGVDTFAMVINDNTDLYHMKAPLEEFNVTGIEIQNQSRVPFFGNYEIEPRGSFDLERVIQLYKIRQVRVQNPVTGVADSIISSNNFYLKGIVQSPDYNTSGLNFSIEDSTGSIIVVSSTDISGYKPTVGDSIELRGLFTQYNGLIEVVADSISILKNAFPVLTPKLVSNLTESTEAQLVKLDGYHLLDTSQWAPKGSSFNVGITNGTDTFTMLISSKTDLYNMRVPFEEFNVTGIEIQDKPSEPFIGDYEIEPRSSFDIERVVQLYQIRQIRVQDAVTGVADSIVSLNNFYLKGIVQSQDFNTSGLNFSIADSTGSILVISSTDISGYKPAVGDSIELRGLLTQYNGLTEAVADSISVLKNASPVVNSLLVAKLTEATEAKLVKLNGYYLLDTSQWLPKGNSFNVNITNGIDTFIMVVNNNTDLYDMKDPSEEFNITGIEIQSDPTSPYFGNYEIEPRGSFDLQRVVQLYKIRQIRVQNPVTGISDSAGSTHNFLLKGIVQSPDFKISGYEFSLKDSTGSVFVIADTIINNYSPTVGDSIEIRGLVTQTNGLTEVAIDSISSLSSGSSILQPEIITSLSESNEAALLKYNRAWLVNPTQWVASGTDFSVDITNGIDTVKLYISNATDVFNMPVPKDNFNVSGIEAQDKPVAPYTGNYMLMPRTVADFQFLPHLLYKIREIKGNNRVSGIADSINTYCYLKGIVQSGNLSGENSGFYALQDSTGSITVTSNTLINGYSPVVGDSIEVRGTVLQMNGLTHFSIDSISKLSSGVQISPVIVSLLDEGTESELVTMNGYRLVDSTKWDTTGANGSFSVKANNATDTITLEIIRGTDLYLNSAKPSGTFDVTGIGSQYDSTMPYFSDYYLIPRSLLDFEHDLGIAPQNSTQGNINIYPNPASGSISITSSLNITDIQITDMLGKVLFTQISGVANRRTVNISSLKQGIYLVKVYNGTNYQIAKIVKD